MNNFKCALFDLDGTLVDTEGQYTIFWGEMARTYRPDIPRLEHIIKGTTLVQIFDRYFPDPEVQRRIQQGLDQWEAQMNYDWVPGALEFLEDLRRHDVQCAIVTSSNQAKMRSVAAKVPGFHQLFDRVLTSEDFTASKPAPDCYLLGAHLFGRELSECVVFEDAFNGLQAGMSSGIYTVGLATGLTPEQIADKCHHVERDFTSLSYERVNQLLSERL